MRYRLLSTFLILSAIVAFIFGNASVRAFCTEACYPFQRISHWAQSHISSRFIAAWRGLCDGPTHDNFKVEIDRLQVLLQANETIAQENEQLRRALRWQKSQPFTVVAAPVWSHGGGLGVWPRLQLAIGSLNGIKEGDVVIVPEGLVGRIADSVTPHTSEVILLSDPACRVAVEVPGGVKGIVQGAQGIDFGTRADEPLLYTVAPLALRFISRNAPLTAGQPLFTEGSGGLFVRGIKVGTVLERHDQASNLLSDVLVEPAVNPTLLKTVFVLTDLNPKKESPSHEH